MLTGNAMEEYVHLALAHQFSHHALPKTRGIVRVDYVIAM
jgi:hypothetical protein